METPTELFQRLADQLRPEPNTPQRRRCSGIKKNGERCRAWSVTGMDKCAGHLKLVPLNSETGVKGRRKAAEKRRLARMNVRDRLAQELENDQQALVDALKDGIRLSDRKAAAKAAGDWIALVYGRQLQKPEDEKPVSDPLDVASMPREERARLARELAEQHPELAARIMGTRPSD